MIVIFQNGKYNYFWEQGWIVLHIPSTKWTRTVRALFQTKTTVPVYGTQPRFCWTGENGLLISCG